MPTRDRATKLYTPTLLALAVELASFPLDPEMPLRGHARSPTCGSVLELSARETSDGAITDLGLQVSACAVGQASAAIFAAWAKGQHRDAIAPMASQVGAWLNGDAPTPEVERLDLLDKAREFPARHGAIMLPWRAILDALCEEPVSG